MLQPNDRDWLNEYKNKTHTYAVYRKPTSDQKTHTDWKWEDGKYIPCKWEAKESWSSNPHVRQKDLKIKITRDKKGHYIMIKGSIQEQDKTIVNIYAPNIGAPQYLRQTLTDIRETDSNTIIVGDF